MNHRLWRREKGRPSHPGPVKEEMEGHAVSIYVNLSDRGKRLDKYVNPSNNRDGDDKPRKEIRRKPRPSQEDYEEYHDGSADTEGKELESTVKPGPSIGPDRDGSVEHFDHETQEPDPPGPN